MSDNFKAGLLTAAMFAGIIFVASGYGYGIYLKATTGK